jgi:hypothetical protein
MVWSREAATLRPGEIRIAAGRDCRRDKARNAAYHQEIPMKLAAALLALLCATYAHAVEVGGEEYGWMCQGDPRAVVGAPVTVTGRYNHATGENNVQWFKVTRVFASRAEFEEVSAADQGKPGAPNRKFQRALSDRSRCEGLTFVRMIRLAAPAG